eukprot:SAG11_NODE_1556_length_4688_cov_7.338636_1_plen_61_part_00
MARTRAWLPCLLLMVVQLVRIVEGGRDYYEVLGLEKTATDKDIKRVRCRCSAPFSRLVDG